MMDELKGDLGAVAMDSFGELLKPREIFVARDRELSEGGCAPGIRDRANLGHDQSDTTSRALFVVGNDRLARVSVFAREFDSHRRHGHPIA